MCCRVVVQQCLKARLAVAENNCVEIGRGIVLFVSFLENATKDDVLRTAKSVLNVKLCDSGEGALVSVLELPGDVLVVPQACLAGKRKGKRVQYHGLVSKDTGQEFYRIFVEQCQILMSERQWCGGKRITTARSGTWPLGSCGGISSRATPKGSPAGEGIRRGASTSSTSTGITERLFQAQKKRPELSLKRAGPWLEPNTGDLRHGHIGVAEASGVTAVAAGCRPKPVFGFTGVTIYAAQRTAPCAVQRSAPLAAEERSQWEVA
ncbi:hypothetical protein HPB47_015001 [Ixodes persulcatus]|uniref:Uncharacterized protein n=1 Tax=Ixodes persulcatus TaxID=34615 RepID=A0AC60QUX1_IXOPE|nr:hypothetical protein HPB47_015001 [Ixodes persulcatus]